MLQSNVIARYEEMRPVLEGRIAVGGRNFGKATAWKSV